MFSKSKHWILFVIVIEVVAFSGMIMLIGQGNVRHVRLSWQEKIEQTVAFEDKNGRFNSKEFLE